MSKTLFIGDSHTCGYQSTDNSYQVWQENNYAESYARKYNKQTLVYAVSGACNSVYKDWLTSMFSKHKDIDEVFVLLSPMNRFIVAYDKAFGKEILPVDYFCVHDQSKDGLIDFYCDKAVGDNAFQLYNKPHGGDYGNFPGLDFSYDEGLKNPDLRKNTFMEIKTFFDLNTHIEHRQFFQDVYTWDNICADHGAKLYLFAMTERTNIPTEFEMYGKLKTTIVAPVTVEKFFENKGIDHSKYYTSDQEHYNKQYHDMIAEEFIPWLKN